MSFKLMPRICLTCVYLITPPPPPKDTFLWTAMMCASWSGQRAAVKLLLQLGAAWVGVVDMQGRDARDLALEGTNVQLSSS